MQIINIRQMIGLVFLLGVAGIALVSTSVAQGREDDRAADSRPLLCDNIQVPPGNTEMFHAYALGSQLYRWNGSSWTFVEPVARLFENSNYRGEVGTHYLGPTWESHSSKVVAARVAGCSVDSTAIDWLLLQAVSTEGSGPFRGVTYIQRVRTVGGKAPVAPGSDVGTVVAVPYTAEYYFYRAGN
jgi:Protein of unknown function (DUF3455)